jgi:hypothetical protein
VVKLDADMRVGFQMRVDLREMLQKAFYLDKLALPEGNKERTAYEVARILEEHVRNLLPIFEPVQVEYSARILDTSFDLLVNMKKVDFSEMPDALQEMDTGWDFVTPIQQAESRLLVEAFMETVNVLTVGATVGASASPVWIDKALRDAVRGVGGPATWRKTEEEQTAEAEEAEEQAAVQRTVGQVGEGAAVAEQVGNAGQALGLIPPPARPGQAGASGEASAEAGAAAAPQGVPQGIDLSAALQAIGGGAAGGAPAQGAPAPSGDIEAEMKEMRMMMRRMMAMISSIEGQLEAMPQKSARSPEQSRARAA